MKIQEEENEELEQPQEEEQLSDVYEVVNESLTIHTQTDIFNKDVSLSDLTDRERWFIREHVRLIDIMHRYIQDREEGKKLKKLMLMDVSSIIIMSRAKEGRLIKGIIAFFTGVREEEEKSLQNMTWWQKLTNKIRPPEQ